MIERSDGTAQLFIGNGVGNGKIYQLNPSQLSDDGAAINSFYATAYFVPSEMEDSLGVGSHRKLFGYLTAYVQGSGSLNLSALADSAASVQSLPVVALSNPALNDLEMPINILAGFLIMMLLMGSMMTLFLNFYAQQMAALL